jgi:cysteine desulfuration protein SufE
MTKIEEWAEELNLFDDATMKLEYLIDLAKKPTDFIDLYKRDDNLIGGCQSKIWVTVMKDKNNKVAVDYDSDAMITKGITHIICSCFNGMSISAAKKVKRDDFEVLGIAQLLTQQRRNGLGNLIDTIIMKVKKL